MNKTEKRQFDLRNKLIAAVAMLLVSCIMMVSTTYAWFTLSTAPEVQGITTTVGANGNLEIALSPYSGDGSAVKSNMGDSTKNWDEKNITWGNLLNLSDNSVYGLGDIKLLPAQLNFSGDSKATAYVSNNPLAIPVYGADGRPSNLDTNTVIGSKHTTLGAPNTGFATTDAGFGVRAIGTSSSLTPQQVTFNAALSALTAAVSSTKTTAQNALKNNGGVLAGIMINYGLGTEETYAKADLSAIGAMIEDLQKANNNLAEAIKQAIIAEASSSASSTTRYDAAIAATSSEDVNAISTYLTTYATGENAIDATVLGYITEASTLSASIASKLTTASTNYNNFTTGDVDDALNIVSPLMNSNNVTVNGFTVDQLKGEDGPADLFASMTSYGGISITLGENSGVFADFGTTVGNLVTSVHVPQFESPFGTISDNNPNSTKAVYATMTTDSEEIAGGYMPAARAAIAGLGALVGGDAASAVINVPYGYIVDFMFRTNATGSNLMLQTDPAQRVYSDSTSSATQGSGSTMSFAVTDALSVDATLNLMKAIRIVFMNTDNVSATDAQRIYAVGKLDVSEYENLTEEQKEALVEIEASVYLYDYSIESVTTGEGEDAVTTYSFKVSNTQIDETVASICPLTANEVKRVSALVYLDGENVTNADVANGDMSLSGALNLQFSSSATLVPMENSALKELTATGEVNAKVYVNGLLYVKETVSTSADYSANVKTVADGYNVTSVVVRINGKDVTSEVYNAGSGALTIASDKIVGDIVVEVQATAG